MKFTDGHEGMYVEVTEDYRSTFKGGIQFMITGNGFGEILGFESGSWYTNTESNWDHNKKLFKLKWSDGRTGSMHPKHLQPSTKKAFFLSALQGQIK